MLLQSVPSLENLLYGARGRVARSWTQVVLSCVSSKFTLIRSFISCLTSDASFSIGSTACFRSLETYREKDCSNSIYGWDSYPYNGSTNCFFILPLIPVHLLREPRLAEAQRFHLPSGEQLPAQHRDGLPTNADTLAVHSHAQHTTTRRCLIRSHLAFPKPLHPEGRQRTMRRAGRGVFIDSDPGRKET